MITHRITVAELIVLNLHQVQAASETTMIAPPAVGSCLAAAVAATCARSLAAACRLSAGAMAKVAVPCVIAVTACVAAAHHKRAMYACTALDLAWARRRFLPADLGTLPQAWKSPCCARPRREQRTSQWRACASCPPRRSSPLLVLLSKAYVAAIVTHVVSENVVAAMSAVAGIAARVSLGLTTVAVTAEIHRSASRCPMLW